jgi:hypothetical protein
MFYRYEGLSTAKYNKNTSTMRILMLVRYIALNYSVENILLCYLRIVECKEMSDCGVSLGVVAGAQGSERIPGLVYHPKILDSLSRSLPFGRSPSNDVSKHHAVVLVGLLVGAEAPGAGTEDGTCCSRSLVDGRGELDAVCFGSRGAADDSHRQCSSNSLSVNAADVNRIPLSETRQLGEHTVHIVEPCVCHKDSDVAVASWPTRLGCGIVVLIGRPPCNLGQVVRYSIRPAVYSCDLVLGPHGRHSNNLSGRCLT